MNLIWRFGMVLMVVLGSISSPSAEPIEQDSIPSLLSSIRISKPLDLCGEKVPIGQQDVRERLEKELMLSLWNRPQVILWLKRSNRYFPVIEQMLKEQGLPEELKFIAVAESALLPHITSGKGAVGFWQFIKSTGQQYGLVIDERIDERRNIFASTRAAILYLKELYDIFQSWTLAAAAYNMGEKRLMAEIQEQGVSDYYQLYLPLETQGYVFRILSAKLIFLDPKQYGFDLSHADYYPPLNTDRVTVNLPQDTPIRIIAQAAKTHFKEIKELNPEFRGHYVPKGEIALSIPGGSETRFKALLGEFFRKWSEDETEQLYLVKEGDNLTIIAGRFGVPVASLLRWNRLDPKAHIHPGDQLKIYRKKVREEVIKPDDDLNNGPYFLD
ncbi:MAG: lytic transglycosylase [Deltaproteobacteria bacterium RBG_13_49_15]|nr:MAG: lytic transglycosylase [Deltaproteobacteria bacterium RBG_13_49_15]